MPSNEHIVVGHLERVRRILHCLQDGCVCVGALQSLPLHLNCGQSAIDLLQLLLVLLFPLKSLDGHCNVINKTESVFD